MSTRGFIRDGVQYMSEVEYYRREIERIEEDNKTRTDHVDASWDHLYSSENASWDLIYNTENSWTKWYVLDVETALYIRAYKFTRCSNPIVELQTPLLDQDEPFQMSYQQFLAVINCMKHTKGQGPIRKLGASHELYLTCKPEAVLVEKYGGPHAYEQLMLPRQLCNRLEREGEKGFLNLAVFQSHILKHDGEFTDDGEETD